VAAARAFRAKTHQRRSWSRRDASARQKSGRARDQSQSAVSRHRSERAHPRLPWHSQCPLAGIGRGTECGAWLDAPRFAAKPQVQGRLASRLRRRPCRSRDLMLMAGYPPAFAQPRNATRIRYLERPRGPQRFGRRAITTRLPRIRLRSGTSSRSHTIPLARQQFGALSSEIGRAKGGSRAEARQEHV
jgi:hypothetical protein